MAIRIAISGKSGCGNTTVSQELARDLGIRMINYTFHTIAEEKGIPFDELLKMANEDDSWDKYLDNKQIEMAMEADCVLGSRLAIWLLEKADLKVYLQAPPEVRAQRIQKREGGELDAIMTKTAKRDEDDSKRYMQLYKIDNTDLSQADMVIDTSTKTPDEIVALIKDRIKHLI